MDNRDRRHTIEQLVVGNSIQIQNSLFSTQHIVHTTMFFFCIRHVEKGTSRRQRLCGLVP